MIYMGNEKPLVVIFQTFAEWYTKEYLETGKLPNLRELGEVFTHKFKRWTHYRFGTHQWQVCVNGQDTEQKDPIGECGIQPYHMHLYRDGWLVGICNPNEGDSVVHSGMLHGLDKEFHVLLKGLLKKKRKSSIGLAHGS